MPYKSQPVPAGERILERYDATALVGLAVVIRNGAIERIDADGERTIELPHMKQLLAAAAVARCLMPIRLRGREMKAIRRIMGLTMAEMAKRLGERTATETVARWESDKQALGGYAEKVLRLVVCSALAKKAPGIRYDAAMLADLVIADPWIAEPAFTVSALEFEMVRLKEVSGAIVDAWDTKLAA